VTGRQRVVSAISLSRGITSLLFLQLVLQPSRFAQVLSLAFLILIEISDFIDGKMARHWKVASELGYILDAFGDRAAYVAYALAAMERAELSPLLAYAIIVRDFGLFASRSYFTQWSKFVDGDRVWSKVNGILTRFLLWCFLATWYDADLGWGVLGSRRSLAVAVVTIITCAHVTFSYIALCLLIQRYKLRGR
jgi:phosphatidylglycerophosphate synthase